MGIQILQYEKMMTIVTPYMKLLLKQPGYHSVTKILTYLKINQHRL
jgi:hypothetical protein